MTLWILRLPFEPECEWEDFGVMVLVLPFKQPIEWRWRVVVRALIIRIPTDLGWCCDFGNPKSRSVNFLQKFFDKNDHGLPLRQKLHIMCHCGRILGLG
jgi:hypothetical protein